MTAPLDLNAILDLLADRLAEKVAAKLSNGNGKDPDPEPDTLLGVDQVAARLGVSPRWIYAHARLLPVVRLPGRALRFSSRGLDRWMDRKQRGAA